jgi:predicted nuclease of restriction endonuclease-like (RecB) superfamily
LNHQFSHIVNLIQQARSNALKSVNAELINLYWNVGACISQEIKAASWGDKTIDELAGYIQKHHPELKGFNRRGLYRMKQFYETYASLSIVTSAMTQIEKPKNVIVSSIRTQLKSVDNEVDIIVSSTKAQLEISDIRNTILCDLSWTHHRTIFTRCQTEEEIIFYIKQTIKEKYTVKELDRQISAGLFERMMLGNTKLRKTVKESYPNISNTFMDSYIFDFLNLKEKHSESDLQKGLISQMKNLVLEIGKDFLFIGEEYKVQVGNSDFYIDLLFYHRSLQCLVAFELKEDKFKPEQLGKLNFYLEALDRDVKGQNENPSIGVLLCKDKDEEVVEYALSRSLSPTMVSEYKTKLPDKKLLQQKLHELFESNSDTIID